MEVFRKGGVELRLPHVSVLGVTLGTEDVSILVELRDRDTGEFRTQSFYMSWPGSRTTTALPGTVAHSMWSMNPLNGLTADQVTRKMLRDALIKMFDHELDELLRIDGEWVDPHVGDRVLFSADS